MLDCPPARPSWTILALRIEQKSATTPMRRSESLRQTLTPSAKTVVYGPRWRDHRDDAAPRSAQPCLMPPETLRLGPRQPRRAGSTTAPAAPRRAIRGRLEARGLYPYRPAIPDRPELNRYRSASQPARTWRRRPKSRRTGTARLR